MIKIPQNSIGHWVIRALWVLLVITFVLYIPTRTKPSTIGDMSVALELATVALSLNLLLGYTGVISIGHSAFYGIGGYVTGIVVTRYDWSQGWTLPISVVVAFVVGAALALPALRLKGIYLALVTLSFGVLFPAVVKWRKLAWLTNGSEGIDGLSYKDMPSWIPGLGELRGREDRAVFMFWMAALVLAFAYVVCRGIVKSRVGRSLIAIRDNETAAAVMGVNLAATKALVFGVSAALTALAGSVATIRGNAIAPDNKSLTLFGSITFLLVMVLGGAATLWGPILGALLYQYIDNRTRDAGAKGDGILGWLFGWMSGSPATLVLAIILMFVIFVAPFGVVGLLRRLAHRFVVIVPSPAGTGQVEAITSVVETPHDGDEFGGQPDAIMTGGDNLV